MNFSSGSRSEVDDRGEYRCQDKSGLEADVRSTGCSLLIASWKVTWTGDRHEWKQSTVKPEAGSTDLEQG